MEMSQKIISEYAKKIYGFAYSKTNNTHDAEDLAQEILLVLLQKEIDFDRIENTDAYIYRICSYTWSNYFRKNKPTWNTLGNIALLETIPSEENVEDNYIKDELYEKLRLEVMYLSKTRRDITIMYYYDNKSGEEIAKLLGIPHSTVRWHIKETKTILKERITMTNQNEIYTPVKLGVGHDGWVTDYDMHGLCSDIIMQNICYICREKALTIEEISRKLGIAAVYIEDKIEKLLYMDYLRLVGSNRYQTTFFIAEEGYLKTNMLFTFNNTKEVAVPIFNMAKEFLPTVKSSGLLDGEFSDEFLMYSLVMPIILRVNDQISDNLGKSYTYPLRKDGSEHWVCAHLPREIDFSKEKNPEELEDFQKNGKGKGVKIRNVNTASSLQFDLDTFGGWREFESEDLKQIERLHTICQTGEEPNDFDKEIIANLCKKGYAKVENGVPSLLVPCFNDKNKFKELFNHFYEERRDDFFDIATLTDLVSEYMKQAEKNVPSYLDKEARSYYIGQNAGFNPYSTIYYLCKNGYLCTPAEDEKKRICTIIFFEK